EDPTLHWYRNTETKQALLGGQGELHIKTIKNKMKDTFGVDVEWRPPMEVEDDEYPFSLCTVREVGHYSVRTMTGNCRTLSSLE
ncbi:hypothetical protein, partial [Clostridioides difficile]|uniref:hypothetical protein n=1 Tax=Clostridioides difficile TaxID=1496 RepID=UPI0020B2E819